MLLTFIFDIFGNQFKMENILNDLFNNKPVSHRYA